MIIQTFKATIPSIGTACTLASIGIYLHSRGFIKGPDGKKTLALISQQVTIPLLLFTKVLYCTQDLSTEPCPDVVRSVAPVWFVWLLLWPAYVVGWGLIVGYVMALWSCTPKGQVRSVLAASAFANSTGLPITLFSVLSINIGQPANANLVDPTLLLSIYLLSYPMLQWGVGSWLLTPETDSNASQSSSNGSIRTDQEAKQEDHQELVPQDSSLLPLADPLLPPASQDDVSAVTTGTSSKPAPNFCQVISSTIIKIVRRCFLQPPVIAAIVGFLVATFLKLRGIFVDIVDRDGDAPTQWFFDALYNVGQAAVPINMILLGSNLSQSFAKRNVESQNNLLSKQTIAAVVFGKLVLMPLIGVGSVVLATLFLWRLPENIHSSFCLVTMMAFLTPTANNVMVMVELSGGNREGIARVIAWQYLAAPVVLSLTVTLAVSIANSSLYWRNV